MDAVRIGSTLVEGREVAPEDALLEMLSYMVLQDFASEKQDYKVDYGQTVISLELLGAPPKFFWGPSAVMDLLVLHLRQYQEIMRYALRTGQFPSISDLQGWQRHVIILELGALTKVHELYLARLLECSPSDLAYLARLVILEGHSFEEVYELTGLEGPPVFYEPTDSEL